MDGTRVKAEEFTALLEMGLGGAGRDGDTGRAAVPFAAGIAASCLLPGCLAGLGAGGFALGNGAAAIRLLLARSFSSV
jgi:hypothetical protein